MKSFKALVIRTDGFESKKIYDAKWFTIFIMKPSYINMDT